VLRNKNAKSPGLALADSLYRVTSREALQALQALLIKLAAFIGDSFLSIFISKKPLPTKQTPC